MPLDLDDLGYNFDLGPPDGIGSQDFLDLELDFGEGPSKNRVEDDSLSIEFNRDAPAIRDPRASLDSALLDQRDKDLDLDALSTRSRDISEPGFDGGGFDMDLLREDTGMDFDHGLTFGEEPPVGQDQVPEKAKSSRACMWSRTLRSRWTLNCDVASPLTELPDTPPPELTPRAAANATNEQTPSKRPSTKKTKDKRQIIDSVIELKDGPGTKMGRGRNGGLGSQVQKDVSEILTDVSHGSLW